MTLGHWEHAYEEARTWSGPHVERAVRPAGVSIVVVGWNKARVESFTFSARSASARVSAVGLHAWSGHPNRDIVLGQSHD